MFAVHKYIYIYIQNVVEKFDILQAFPSCEYQTSNFNIKVIFCIPINTAHQQLHYRGPVTITVVHLKLTLSKSFHTMLT